jgi:L-fucose isomerase-like protein
MKKMTNMPTVHVGLVGVSRDCFPIELARRRLKELATACRGRGLTVTTCSVVVETEKDATAAAVEMREKGINALALYLGNFGPEGPTTILARELGVPFMLIGAAEESRDTLVQGRGDAYCGMLNACLNAGLRNLRPYVPPVPVGLPAALAESIAHFADVARVLNGLRGLKVLAFGPRPQDFYACNAPIKPLYNLGIEVMENSELDLLQLYQSVAGRKPKIAAIARDMAKELGEGNRHPEKLAQLAQFELALETFMEANLGSRSFAVFANKCWPAFERAFGFVPCYVNSRFAGRGIPAACEVDIYGAVSEYMAQLAGREPVTILDINNTVPDDLEIADLGGVSRRDLFMGFHCGNTPSCCLCPGCSMKFQLIMNRLMEDPAQPPNITCGTLEGTLKPGPATIFRLQATPDGAGLMSYIAQGRVLDADPRSFGGIGVIGVPGMARFYRHVLLARQFPHHTALAFKPVGAALFDALSVLGVGNVGTPLPDGTLYPGENPFTLVA